MFIGCLSEDCHETLEPPYGGPFTAHALGHPITGTSFQGVIRTAYSTEMSVSHYHTPSRELMAHTHTLLWSSFQVCGGYLCIFQCRCIFFFLLEGRRTSGWSSAPFTFYLSSCWRRSCRERTSVMNQAPAGSCDPTRRGRTPLGRRNHRPRGPNHPPLGGVAVKLLASARRHPR